MSVKIFIFTKICLLVICASYLFLDFGYEKFVDKLILFLIIFSIWELIKKRKKYIDVGYINLKFDNFIYTGPLIILICFTLINLQLINIDNLEREKDFSFKGYIVHADLMYWGYDSSNGKGFLRDEPLEGSRYVPSTGDFLFLESMNNERIGFVNCSIFTGNCVNNYKKSLPKDRKELVYITYQPFKNVNSFGKDLILTGIK